MGDGSQGSFPTLPPGEGGNGTKGVFSGREPATQPLPANPPTVDPPTVDLPPQPATIMKPVQPQAAGAPHEPVTDRPRSGGGPTRPPSGAPSTAPSRSPSEVSRFGPGVPASAASAAGVSAESVWRTGQRPGAPPRQQRLRRVRRALGSVVTVVLLVAAGVVVWLRFFDHPSLGITGVAITGQTTSGCTVDVTGQIKTNGSGGTVSYQWVFQPQTQAPQPLNQTVVSGQHAVYVTVAVEGQGHGSAAQKVTLDVLGPGTGSAFTNVSLHC
jgi:hypothetical protein